MARRPMGVTSFSSDFGTPIPLAGPGDGAVSDYRDVPLSDTGDGYHDRGARGSYAPYNNEPWPAVPEVRCFEGFGATEADLQLGFIRPTITNDPMFDKDNYRERLTEPKMNDEDLNNTGVLEQDWEFRTRNRRAKGFLTRPMIPTER